MKSTSLLPILTSLTTLTSAHYFFNAVVTNGITNTKVIRTSTRATKYNPIKFSSNPVVDIHDGSFVDGPDIRCNQGAFASAGKTDVLTIAAGEEVQFKLADGVIIHPGPGLVYMSHAPGNNVKAYDGSGDWFKIFQEGVCNAGDFSLTAWCSHNLNYIAATIPKDTPSGEYLVRVEHIGIHKSFHNQPEHYVSCAQVKVTGSGTGVPGPLVKFPGAYKDTDAYANLMIHQGTKPFTFPGPAVWNGASYSTGTTPAAIAKPTI